MHNSNLPCFHCGKTVQVDGDTEVIRDCLPFTSRGAFGSFYDPMNGGRQWLRIHICDECVKEGARKGTVFEAKRTPVPDDITYRRFDPDNI